MADTVPTVVDNAAQCRFELHADGQIAVLEYVLAGDHIRLVHTEVPAGLRHRGYAEALARAGLDHARANGLKAVPLCPFVRAFLKRHPEYEPVLDREACKEAAFQAWKTEGLYHVVFDGLWKCGRCGMLIQPRQAHYHNEPGAAKARRTARRARTRCGARRRQAREDRRGSRPPGCTRNRRRRRPGPSALR